jgi:hypothetical protein
MECRPSVRKARWHNFDLLREAGTRAHMAQLILDSLSPLAGYLRVHDSGDFWAQDYLDAWLDVARERPETTFYAYTKALSFWVRRLEQVGDGHEPGELPNVVLTASWGGKHDRLIGEYGLRSARVVYSEEEAAERGLEIDHDDGCAMAHGDDFALLIHGMQPKGSKAAEAMRELRKGGWRGYGESSRKALAVLE